MIVKQMIQALIMMPEDAELVFEPEDKPQHMIVGYIRRISDELVVIDEEPEE